MTSHEFDLLKAKIERYEALKTDHVKVAGVLANLEATGIFNIETWYLSGSQLYKSSAELRQDHLPALLPILKEAAKQRLQELEQEMLSLSIIENTPPQAKTKPAEGGEEIPF